MRQHYFILCLALMTSLVNPKILEAKECKGRFILFSLLKCGTHLFGKALDLITKRQAIYKLCGLPKLNEAVKQIRGLRKNNQFLVAHNFYPNC